MLFNLYKLICFDLLDIVINVLLGENVNDVIFFVYLKWVIFFLFDIFYKIIFFGFVG